MTDKIKNILNKYDLLECEIYEDNKSSDFDFDNNTDIVICINQDFYNVDSMQVTALNCLNELNELYTDKLYVLYRLYRNTINDQIIITTSDVISKNLF